MTQSRLQRRAEERRQRRKQHVAARLASMGSDPVLLAKRIEELDLILQGAYAIVHVLVREHPELQGLTIPYEKLKAIPPVEHLRTERNRRGDVTLVFEVDDEAGEAAGPGGLDAPEDDASAEVEAGREAEPAPPARGRRRPKRE